MHGVGEPTASARHDVLTRTSGPSDSAGGTRHGTADSVLAMPTPEVDPTAPNGSLEDELNALHRASEERTAELKAIAAQLPAVVGRRAMIRALVGDVRANPNKGEITQRGVRKLGRMSRHAYNRAVYRLRSGDTEA